MAKLNVGFIGCGGIARQHINALTQIPTAKLIGFCDVDLQKARAVAEELGGKAFQVP
ncbi:MAG: Gfo/Idh/MocA family oxidoreductase, partial [Armatimonadetes bacterium]|nr:Gfo/Idh/MocA family oxidoreductase [Armatimonadota bacterium]